MPERIGLPGMPFSAYVPLTWAAMDRLAVPNVSSVFLLLCERTSWRTTFAASAVLACWSLLLSTGKGWLRADTKVSFDEVPAADTAHGQRQMS